MCLRSLLKILDNLQNSAKPNLQLLSESFLTHSLLHNDIPRIINPILLKLLAPNTARVSIRYVNIHDSDTQSEITSQDNQKVEDSHSKKIYAVSSVNGNIMYHITDDPSPKPPKRKWFTFSKSGGGGGGGNNKKYSPTIIDMTTSIVENSSSCTNNQLVSTAMKKNNNNKSTPSKLIDKTTSKTVNISGSGSNMKLFINPLSAKEIYSDGVDGSYSKLETNSQKSSMESLPSSNDTTPNSNDGIDSLYTDKDSGFDSLVMAGNNSRILQSDLILNSLSSKKLLEKFEPISDGIKDEELTSCSGVAKSSLPKSHSFDEKYRCHNGEARIGSDLENLSLVHSWSYCMSDSDNLNAELELSASAEDFFKSQSDIITIVTEIVNDIVDKVCALNNNHRPTDLDLKPVKFNNTTPQQQQQQSKNCVLYPIHTHICLYYDLFDSNQVIYALQTLKNSIVCNPQLFIRCLATSGIKNLKNNDILMLLAKHRKSLLGLNFNGELNPEYINFYRGYMFLDVIISICLNYSRTFYPYIDDLHITSQEMNNNLKIQLESLEILDIIVKNLIIMVKESSKGFSSYIGDMLVKCKLQKILLHCLLTSVRSFDEDMTFAEEVLLYNRFQLYDGNSKVGEHIEAYQIQLLR